jgi:competence protein ComEA
VKNLRSKWGERLLLAATCAVLFGSVGYFLGVRSRGAVYQISGSQSSTAYVAEENEASQEESQEAAEETESATETETTGLVDINRADVETLMTLPGIGETKAQAIVDYRTNYGPFQTVDDLLLVSGIGESTLEGLRDLVTVDGE